MFRMSLVWSVNVPAKSKTPIINPNCKIYPKFFIPLKKPSSPSQFSVPSRPRFGSRCLHSPIVNEFGKDSDHDTSQEEDNQDYGVGVNVALSILKFYKSEISPLLPKSCRYVPTCSEYSMIAYKKYGVTKGSILTAWRICRCNPLGGSGFDPPRWFDEPSPPEE